MQIRAVLEVFFLFQEAYFFPFQQVVGIFARAKSHDNLDWSLFSHCQNQDSLSVLLRDGNLSSCHRIEEAVRILSFCEFSSSFGLQSWCTGSILFEENFSSHQ